VTRGQLAQRAGLLGLNGGGTAAAVPPLKTIFETQSLDQCKTLSLLNQSLDWYWQH